MLTSSFTDFLAWAPRGHALAVADNGGISIVNAATGAARVLTTDEAAGGAWSPDGTQLAYFRETGRMGYYLSGDLRVVTLAAATWTIVSAGGAYGEPYGIVWARVPKGAHYRRPQPRTIAELRADGLTAPWPITHLAADGERVAYASCGHVFVWTPSARTVVQGEAGSSMSPACSTPDYYDPYWIYTLALSANRVAVGAGVGTMSQTWWLHAGSIGDPTSFETLASQDSQLGCYFPQSLGDLMSAGGLLVFSTWQEKTSPSGCPARTVEQEIHRVDAGGCPCGTVASSPGPLVPFDVDGGRIVAGGENATVLYDPSGTPLLSVSVSPLAAQLSGSSLVVLTPGELRVYDAATGVQLHAWPLPDVPAGADCGAPHSFLLACNWHARLILEDAARGLAAYVLDGQIQVLRLTDGADAVVAAGTLARFIDAGLVYADGADLHLVPFDRLPVR